MSAGCKINDNSTDGFAAAIALAKASDIVILALGIDSSIETESHDRTDIDLPSIQHQLAAAISSLGIQTVMVLFHAGSVDISPELSNPSITAILDGHYPGKRGSEAIALTLFGQNDVCCGKLSYTVYPAYYVNTIAMSDMELDGNVGRGYRYYSGPTVLPFAYGLSFATFHFADISTALPIETLSTEKSPSRVLTYSVNITNIGTLVDLEVSGPVNLGNVGNLTIGGITANYVLTVTEDGSGLNWLPTQKILTNPGGTDTQVQFNDNNGFGGNARLTFNKSSGLLT
jgi:beta-D-xylosidase 4